MSSIGTVWEPNSWEDGVWEDDTWEDVAIPVAVIIPIVTPTHLNADKYISIQNMSSESFNETLDKDWESQDWPNE